MAKQTLIAVTLHIRVTDPEMFAATARHRAKFEGTGHEDDANEYTKENLTSCAVMLFDPGYGPGGCEILETEAQEITD